MSFNPSNGAISGASDVALSNPADNQSLTYDTAVGKWRNENTATSVVTTKGDLIVGTGAGTVTRLAAATNGQAVVTDSTTGTGLKYAPIRAISVGDTAPTGTINAGDVWIDTSGT